MSQLTRDEVKDQLRRAKTLSRRGDLTRAKKALENLVNFVIKDHGWIDPGDDNAAIIESQLASISAINKDAQRAREYFTSSLSRSTKPVTIAITLRNWGNFELLEGNIEEADRLIKAALGMFEQKKAQGKMSKVNFDLEKAVTRGFQSRLAIVTSTTEEDRQQHLARLRTLDIRLEQFGSTIEHKVSRLANIGWIISTTNQPIDRKAYIRKAIVLSKETGKSQKKREYQALLAGGGLLRSSYLTSSQLIGFGGKTFKAIVRR